MDVSLSQHYKTHRYWDHTIRKHTDTGIMPATGLFALSPVRKPQGLLLPRVREQDKEALCILSKTLQKVMVSSNSPIIEKKLTITIEQARVFLLLFHLYLCLVIQFVKDHR